MMSSLVYNWNLNQKALSKNKVLPDRVLNTSVCIYDQNFLKWGRFVLKVVALRNGCIKGRKMKTKTSCLVYGWQLRHHPSP